jgi:hypothetical protein
MRRAVVALSCVLAAVSCARSSPPPPTTASTVAPTTADPAAMERAALEQHVAAGMERLRACYRREMARDPQIERRMGLVVYVMPSGRVQDLVLMDADRSDPARSSQLTDAIAKCLGVEVAGWAFPPTDWHGEIQFAQPLLFIARFMPKREAEVGTTTLDKPAIKAVIKQREAATRACYDDYLVRAPDVDRLRVMVRFLIPSSGVVSDVKVLEPPELDPAFAACLLGVIRTMSFGAADKRQTTIVDYPFVFITQR